MYRPNQELDALALATSMTNGGGAFPNRAPATGVAPVTQYVATPQLGAMPQATAPAAPAPAAPAAPQTLQPEPAQLVPVNQPAPPTVQEYQAACPGAPADFVLSMLTRQVPVAQAQTEFIRYQQTLLAQQQAQPAPAATVPQQAPPAPQQTAVPFTPAQPFVTQQPPAQPFPAPAPVTVQHQLPGNAPIQVEPAQHDPTLDLRGGSRQHWEHLVMDRKNLLMQGGMNPADAQQKAVVEINQQHPGLRQKAFNIPPLWTPQGFV